MADHEEQVTSTTSFGDEPIHQADLLGMDDVNEAAAREPFNADDIVDLVGGAQDAIDRHIAEYSTPTQKEDPELFSHQLESEPESEPEPEPVSESADVSTPVVHEYEYEPAAPPHTTVTEEYTTLTEEYTPGSDTLVLPSDEPAAAPRAEPESTRIVPEPQVAPPPVTPEPPLPSPAAPPPAPAAAAAAAPPTREEEASVAPASPSSFSDLLYWRDVKTTGVVFGAALLLLLSLTACSIVSVASYIALALLSVTVSFRIYKGILQAIQKSDDGHPFKLFLDREVAMSEDVAHKYSDLALARVNKTIVELRRLFLVDDLVDSIKFAVLMWILTYVGALFNGLTLLILGLVAVFSFPIVYEKHQVQIDHYVGMVNTQVKDIVGKIQAKVPGAKRKAE
ncbi:hypothetical protein NHX12_022362 [Muraenolepis orangiensis]|uniref:Reticulon n=1 Tax=Muraenolepis orangiensis TaxID=630683 RepID=A0A9Q0ITG4_9TELE|nr:hypothetical protein NHX12_022362 [Muraenolepis orangiensis]